MLGRINTQVIVIIIILVGLVVFFNFDTDDHLTQLKKQVRAQFTSVFLPAGRMIILNHFNLCATKY
jgi:hypothetical protein